MNQGSVRLTELLKLISKGRTHTKPWNRSVPAPAAWLQGAECPCCGRSKLLPSSQTHFSVEQAPDLAVGAAMPLLITLRAAMPLVITTLRVVPLGACRPALSKGSSSTPGSTSGLPQPHSCGSTLSRIWPEKSIFTRNLSLVLKHLQLPGPAPAPRPRLPPAACSGAPRSRLPLLGYLILPSAFPITRVKQAPQPTSAIFTSLN